MLARLSPDAAGVQLALSSDDHPNLVLRNLGTADATDVQITASGYSVASGCGTMLPAGGECSIALTGTAAGSLTVQAANFPAFITTLPASLRVANAVTVLPHALDFGIVTAGSALRTRTLTVRNFSSTAQTFLSQRINAVTSSFTVSQSATTCGIVGDGKSYFVPANGTCIITLQISPSASTESDAIINATWQVGAYDVALTGYAQPAATSLSTSVIDFGRQFVNGIRAPRYLYLSNASDGVQAHAALASTNPVFTLSDECPASLQPRSVCRIRLDYHAAVGPSSDALSLTVDGSSVVVLGETLPQPAAGATAANPNLLLSASSLSFADPVTVSTASAAVQTLTVSNTGVAALALDLSVTGDFTFATNCSAALLGGESCTVTMTFTPSAPGTRKGLLSVAAGSTGPAYVALSGTGVAILPANNGISFGDIPLNTPTVLWLKVQKALVSATATSTDPSYKVILVEDTGFGHGAPPAASFQPTAIGSCLNCWLGVQFTPTTVGSDLASVKLSSSSAGKATTLIVSGNGVPLTGLILTPLMEDFGTIAVHTSTSATLLQLTNATGSTITTSSATLAGDFSVSDEVTGTANCQAAVLVVGATCLLPIRFTPAAVGTRSGQITIQTSGGSASASLAGTGADDPGVSFTPGELRFNNVPGLSARQQIITLANTGSVPERVGTPISSDSHFSVSSGCSTLAEGASCTITVTYTPTDTLTSGTLTVPITSAPAGAPSASTFVLALTGLYTSETAGLQIVPGEHTTVHYGALAAGTVSPFRLLHVNNLTAQAMTLSVAAPKEFSVASQTCGALPPNGSCDLSVSFMPLTNADVTGTVFLQGTPSEGSATRNGLAYLEGYGQGAGSLRVDGNVDITGVLGFGQVASGQSAKQTITLTNPVGASATVTVRRVVSEAPFLTTTTCGDPLAPGQSCAVTITYAPVFQLTSIGSATARSDTASVLVESDAANAPLNVNLAGQASPVAAAKSSDGGNLATFTTSQGSLRFENTAVGSASAVQSVQLANTGNVAVHVLGVATSSNFAATTDCSTLQPGATCAIGVSYRPQTDGQTLGALEIRTDAVTSLEFVSLVGSGSAASVSLSPQSVDFGRVLLGRTAAQNATLTNTGAVAVTVNSIGVSGTDFSLATSSSAANPCPSNGPLAAGASCTIAVIFAPRQAATERGTLSVATSATALPLTVALSGVGTQPELAVTPATLNFGNVTAGSSATLSITLRNTSAVAVNSLSFAATAGFTVSSTCGLATLAAGSSCAVSVTFSPTSAAAATGTLTITSDDPASPLLVPLSGTGVAAAQSGSFTLTVNGGATSSATVTQGISALYSLLLTPAGGFNGTVAFTCTPDSAAQFAACSLLPATVTLAGGPQSSTATITTLTAVNSSLQRRGGSILLACLAPTLLFAARKRRATGVVLIASLAAGLNGCGGGGDPRIRYTPPGTYTFRVTASSTTGTVVSQTVILTLVVKQR